ncbi:transmembrane protein 115 isoform X2 [Lagopus leucura]|uniref:transmembrane protein 115 isoform X2 n=1 Tax=Lagopus leucura TaxID=30410 RepID=UPI001C66CC26|nr:transmembrane protein 115 isoform X2 [Lagopus leucura]
MRRYLPVARQHCVAALGGTSVVVKAVSGAVLLLYALSFALDTAYGLAVTPGFLFLPRCWLWTLLTHGLVERRAAGVALSLGAVVAAGRLLEPRWGALELLVFFAVVNASVGLLGAAAYFLTYAATFHVAYLFDVHIHGGLGFLAGVLVALKQTMGDSTVLRVPQRHSRGRGDMSDHFAFATFFPEILQPAVGLAANLVHTLLVKVRLCRKTVKRYDVGAPSSITISLPGTDPQDAERRRQLALKALNERLKRVEDQTAWPSMEDEEEEVVVKSEGPLLPEASVAGKAAGHESSLITFEDAPSQP